MLGDSLKILVRRQHDQLMADSELREERIDRPHLNAASPAAISQFRRGDMVLPIRGEQWKRAEAIDDRPAGAWTREALEQFLQDETRRHDRVATLERFS
jgi:hypothetical protein